ncbi:MAG: PTS sugar transporter subunit IIA [Clostridiales bacterium]|nr:PTS sugar transporter subunit IIA [Clostridiales bacterium]
MNLLKPENVQICESAANWQDAIRISTHLLERNGYVEPRYKEEIIANVERLGPYIVIADHIVLPHARPEQGALQTQIGVTLFRRPVTFDNGADGQLFVTLAASDNNSHLDALMEISELLSEEDAVNNILASSDEETLYRYFQ